MTPADGTGQRMVALAEANRVRFARAKLKRMVRAGDVVVEQVVAAPPEWASTMTVAELLAAQRRWGTMRTRMVCDAAQVGEKRKLGWLTPRQRMALIVAVRERKATMEKSAQRTERKKEQARREGKQLQFDGMAETMACPECVRHVPAEELRQSLWGMCKECENGRLSV